MEIQSFFSQVNPVGINPEVQNWLSQFTLELTMSWYIVTVAEARLSIKNMSRNSLENKIECLTEAEHWIHETSLAGRSWPPALAITESHLKILPLTPKKRNLYATNS